MSVGERGNKTWPQTVLVKQRKQAHVHHTEPCCCPSLQPPCSDKGVDFAAHSNSEDGGAVFLNLLGNLAFPLLLVGGLFLLSRRQVCAPGAAFQELATLNIAQTLTIT